MTHRDDIQILRGIAVLLILLFHAGMGGFSAGYLGVDIFFVISGFLITGVLIRAHEEGRFSFRDFYFRRAKRLLPAAYGVFFLTVVAAPFFLSAADLEDFRAQLWGALSFTANIVLWEQADYFDSAAKLKPLLHIWSLSIEEQFYFLFPAFLFFVPRMGWKRGIEILILVSLALCLWLVPQSPDLAFYHLPMRAWELGLGAWGGVISEAGRKKFEIRAQNLWRGACLVVLIALPVAPFSALHPFVDAVLVCAACAALLLLRIPLAEKGWHVWFTRPLAKVGDYSYALYLVHWPVFAFANNAYLSGEIPLSVRMGLLAFSVLLALLLYYGVENPLHRAQILCPKRFVASLLLCALVLAAFPLVDSRKENAQHMDYNFLRRHNYGLDKRCSQKGAYEPLPICQTEQNPALMVWGDSYAMHLVPGLKATKTPLIQATKSACAPFLDLAVIDLPKTTASAARACIEFNHAVLAQLAQMPSVQVVVLSSPFTVSTSSRRTGILREEGVDQEVTMGVPVAVREMTKTIEAIRGLGKDVVIVSPPPKPIFNVGECWERKESGLVLAEQHKNCSFTGAEVKALSPSVYEFLEEIAAQAKVDVIRLEEILCAEKEAGLCQTKIGEFFLYRDNGHLTYEGSEALFLEQGRAMLMQKILLPSGSQKKAP